MMHSSEYRSGDLVVYTKTKYSTNPGPRARSVQPARQGDGYNYTVDKFWLVDEVLDDGQLQLRTRRGKTNTVAADDPNLRRASWWERLLYGGRFPRLQRAS